MTIARAVALWNDGSDKFFDFCSEIVRTDDDVEAVAAKVKRSPALIRGYKKVGQLWTELLQADSAKAEHYRDAMRHPTHWTALARTYYNGVIERNAVWRWLNLCVKNEWTVEEFRNELYKLDPGDETPLKEDAPNIARYVTRKIIKAPSFGFSDRKARRLVRVAKLLVKELESE